MLWLLGCTGPTPVETATPTPPPECVRIQPGVSLGQVPSPPATEISGLAVQGDRLWAHNDSGDIPAIFAFERTGQLLGIWELDAPAIDFEDLAADSAGTLYVADIGDNAELRETVSILAVSPTETPQTLSATTRTLTYEDGPRDAETLLVDEDGTLWVLSKSFDGLTGVYEAVDDQLVRRATLQFGEAPLGRSTLVTGGDLGPRGLVLRTYLTEAFVWPRAPGEDLLAVLEREPCAIELAPEPQPEAIAFGPDGLYTVSEGLTPNVHFHPWEDE